MTGEVRKVLRQAKRLHKRVKRSLLVCLNIMHILAISDVKLKQNFVKLVIHFIPTYQIK